MEETVSLKDKAAFENLTLDNALQVSGILFTHLQNKQNNYLKAWPYEKWLLRGKLLSKMVAIILIAAIG